MIKSLTNKSAPIHQFPVGYKPKKAENIPSEKNILLYFNNGTDNDKSYGNELYLQLKDKYSIKLNIGPKAKLEAITSALEKQGLDVKKPCVSI